MGTHTDVGRPTRVSSGDDGRSGDDPGTLSDDDVFHLLQSGRRRAVLRYLYEHEEVEVFGMRAIAEAVAAWESGKPVEQLRSDERQRVYISLYQSHLPKLDEFGVVDYDQPRGTVSLGPDAPALVPYLAEGLHAPQTLHVEPGSTGGSSTDSLGGVLGRFVRVLR